MNEKPYYQFDLNFHGDYIRGKCSINENLSYYQIEDPEINIGPVSKRYQISPKHNIINLSKNAVVCFYKI